MKNSNSNLKQRRSEKSREMKLRESTKESQDSEIMEPKKINRLAIGRLKNIKNDPSNDMLIASEVTAFEVNLLRYVRKVARDGVSPVLGLDIFDTILIRRVDRPSDVFAIVDRYAYVNFKIPEGVFYGLRIRAEREARILAASKGRKEITLDDITDRIYELSDIPNEYIDALMLYEIECEKSLIAARDDVLNIIAKHVSHFSSICLISDTYFPADVIEKFLDAAKISNYLKHFKVYLSSQVNETKHEGGLIPWVLEKERIEKNSFIYVGDNVLSDVINSNKSGVLALNIPKTSDFAKAADLYFSEGVRISKPNREGSLQSSRPNGLAASFLQSIISQRAALLRAGKKELQAFLSFSSALATLWCGFISHIRNEVRFKGIPHVFFLSRDGYVFHKIWGVLYPESPASYLNVSRELLYKIYFGIDYQKACSFVFQNYSDHTLRESICRLFDDDNIHEEIFDSVTQIGYELDATINSQPDVMKYVTLKYKLQLLQQAQSRYQRYLAYLKNAGFLSHSKVAIVDIGWHGSLQSILKDLLQHANHSVEINGYYLGLFEGSPSDSYNCYYDGYLCGANNDYSFESDLKESPSLIEMLHAAPHGSTFDFSSDLTPILRKNDIQESSLKKITLIQQNAISLILDFLKPLLRLTGDEGKLLSMSEASKLMMRILKSPKEEEVLMVRNFSFCPDFGLDKVVSLLSVAGCTSVSSHWTAGDRMLSKIEFNRQQKIPAWFDEANYLKANPDVAASVMERKFSSGYEHYVMYGKKEHRMLSI